MARIYIDGYNVIGVMHGNLEAERQRFIEELARYHKSSGHEVTVIFDGWRGGFHEETHLSLQGVQVVYSRLAEKADSVIKRLLEGRPGSILVSSDRELVAHAWAHGSVPVGSEIFLGRMTDEARFEEPFERRRGQHPSKKQKALERAIKKL